MAEQTDNKADAAAEKAYADASGEVSVREIADAVEADAPKPQPDTSKIAKAVKAEVAAKAAPPKPAAKKKAAAAKSRAKPVRKTPTRQKSAAKPGNRSAEAAPRAKSPTISSKDTIMASAKTTNQTSTDFAKTAQNAATELQTRARAAYDKAQAYAGDVTEFNKGNFEAFVEAGKIFTNGMQTIARSEAEAAKSAFETATADLKALAAVKSPTELFKLQGEIARRNFDAAVAHYSRNAEVSMKLANDAFAPLSSRVSLAAEKVSQAA
jgi:phasin family protein